MPPAVPEGGQGGVLWSPRVQELCHHGRAEAEELLVLWLSSWGSQAGAGGGEVGEDG